MYQQTIIILLQHDLSFCMCPEWNSLSLLSLAVYV